MGAPTPPLPPHGPENLFIHEGIGELVPKPNWLRRFWRRLNEEVEADRKRRAYAGKVYQGPPDPASFEKALANTSGIREAILGTVTKHNAQPRRRCPYCGRHNRPGPDTCPGCGATTEEA